MKRVLAIALVVVTLTCVGWCAFGIWASPKGGLPKAETVLYSKVNGEELYLDLYRPTEAKSIHRAVVLIHGGGWAAGNKRDMAGFAKALTDKGFFCASVQYRFAPKYVWPAQLDDVQTAVRYVRAHAKEFQIDPTQVASCGGSAGGHLAQCLGVRDTRDPKPTAYPKESSRVQAVWNIFGPTDFTQTFSELVNGLIKSFLGEVTPQKLKDVSPIFFVDKTSAPTFFLQGKKDPLVPWQQAELMANKLKSVGVEADLNLIEGMEHSPDMSNPEVVKTVERAMEWLKLKLSKK